MQKQKAITVLPFIVAAQFACTSVWFAGNAVITDIIRRFSLAGNALGHLVAAVQLGFITGTLLFAIFTVSDRFSPSRVFFTCAIAASLTNLSVFVADGFSWLLIARFMTGFFLAGIYPVGMKIAADYHNEGLGKALGWLVGALVLGTAFPHLVHVYTSILSWKGVMIVSSVLSVLGGMLILMFVPDGPHRSRSNGFDSSVLGRIFHNGYFRSAAFGYFGHMWELYTFWSFVPSILFTYFDQHTITGQSVSMLSFCIISAGAVACVVGGYLSRRIGSVRTASMALVISACCCLLSPLFFHFSFPVFFLFLLVWGMSVVADSPQFSTLVAQAIPAEIRGTALTITNSIGFAITIISIETINYLRLYIDPRNLYLILAIGPILGLLAMKKQMQKRD